MFDKSIKIIGVSQKDAFVFWRLLSFENLKKGGRSSGFILTKDGEAVAILGEMGKVTVLKRFGKIWEEEKLSEIAKTLGKRFLVVIEVDELRKIVEEVQSFYRYDWDAFDFADAFFASIKNGCESKKIIIYPDIFRTLFALNSLTMRKFFDAIFPMGSSMVFFLFSGNSIEAGVVLVRKERLIDTVLGHEVVMEGVKGFYPWYRGYRALIESTGRRYAQPCLGFFAEVGEIEKILWHPEPGAFTGAMITQKIIIDPMPPWVAGAVGVDVVTKLAKTSAEIIKQLDSIGLTKRFDIGETLKNLRRRIEKKDFELEKILGFDPIGFLVKVINILAGNAE